MKTVSPQTRTFVLAAVAVSLAVWQFGFNLGAFQTIFFEHVFMVWIASLAVFLACVLLPGNERPIRGLGLLALLVPSLWLFVAVISQFANATLGWLVFVIGSFVLLVCLPYVSYILLLVMQRETVEQPRRLLWRLVIVALVIGSIAYVVGSTHYLLLTCHDFEISGNFKPANCWQP